MTSNGVPEATTNGGTNVCDVSHSDPLHVFQSLDKASKERKKKLAIEEIYQRKTQLEHILLRPDTYIGSIEPHTDLLWVYDEESEKMVQRNITYVPGLYKIFDEIIVNAADNKQRDPRMNCIKVDINQEKNEIKIWNNGKGIPVVEHKIEKMFVPEMIFGTLLTSSNYDDSERKVTGGRNGYGAKLCNIFSKKFTVETSSREYRKAFKQTWTDNMTKSEKPVISASKDEDYTYVKFIPDLSKFGMTQLDNDIVALMSRRAYDIAGTCAGVKVYLNGKRLKVSGFKSYIELYTKDRNGDDGEPLKIVYEQPHVRWEVAVTVSDKGFQQVSFVNSIATVKGGRHVDYITDVLVEKIIDVVKKQLKKTGLTIRPFQVKNHIWIFLNCLIENPTFDSQTKENMTLPPKSFGSKCTVSEKFLAQMTKSGIVDSVMQWMKFKAQARRQHFPEQRAQLNKQCHATKHSKLKGVPKLEDANEAGTKNSQRCTLILTEGDSAKTLAVAGFSVVGRDYFGVFPLRGKLLNVREASYKQIMANAEINNLVKIIGLQYKRKYETADDLRSLRYGKLMIMADQDQDGSHIKGLLINFIHHNWPSLIRHNFVEEFITPIVKVTKGKEEKAFFSLPEYEKWKMQTNNWHTWKIKYYKGLGTSTAKEAKEYFSDMGRHRIRFRYDGNDDDKALELAFSKKMVDDRKDWLSQWMQERRNQRSANQPETYLYQENTTVVTYKEFVDKELIIFSNMDNERSIPSLVDGLKPGQRKVLFTCFKRNDKREVKVAQLAGSVAEMSSYHHGEVSLMATIVNLAHNFVGSNNINLLLPIGQFGTRLQGGKDSASPRYIFTLLNPVTRALFNPADEACLNYLFDDNQKIEPEWYCPILPTVLVNGAEGIGTAWSTKVPNFNPRDLVENLRRLIRDEPLIPMHPWYKNFRGQIRHLGAHRYACFGEVALLDDGRLEISELPIGVWTQQYKENVLEPMLYGSDNKQALIQDYKEYHTDTTVRFVIQMTPQNLAHCQREGVHKVFKLQNFINTSQMVLFDAEGCLRRFGSAEEILRCFYDVRLSMYEKRKNYMESLLDAQSNRLRNQARFILEKIEGTIKIENLKKKLIVKQLVERKYDPDPVKMWKEKQRSPTSEEVLLEEGEEEATSEEVTEGSVEAHLRDYDYLLSMAVLKLSLEEKDKILRDRDCKIQELEALRNKSPKDLWSEDLDQFMIELEKRETIEKEEELMTKDARGKGDSKIKGGKTSARPVAKKLNNKETAPSEEGTRIEPLITDELRQKVEKVEQARQRQLMIKEAELRGDADAIGLLKKRNRKPRVDGIVGPKVIGTSRIRIGIFFIKSFQQTAKQRRLREPKGETKKRPRKGEDVLSTTSSSSDQAWMGLLAISDSSDNDGDDAGEEVQPVRSLRERKRVVTVFSSDNEGDSDSIFSPPEDDNESDESYTLKGKTETKVKTSKKGSANQQKIAATGELKSPQQKPKSSRTTEADDYDFVVDSSDSSSSFEPSTKRKKTPPAKKEAQKKDATTAAVKKEPIEPKKKFDINTILSDSLDDDDDIIAIASSSGSVAEEADKKEVRREKAVRIAAISNIIYWQAVDDLTIKQKEEAPKRGANQQAGAAGTKSKRAVEKPKKEVKKRATNDKKKALPSKRSKKRPPSDVSESSVLTLSDSESDVLSDIDAFAFSSGDEVIIKKAKGKQAGPSKKKAAEAVKKSEKADKKPARKEAKKRVPEAEQADLWSGESGSFEAPPIVGESDSSI
ncbi:DNA gyrase/topoisomerase IV, A subunit [Trichuris suis]|nr:DNA gyrase/topoisomerase IV, A subunit [Trichuris suis]